jgi:DNA-binding NarL/FixJ family response regulator
LDAAESAALGETILHPTATEALLEQLRGETPLESLTPRETEVLRAVAAGQTNKAIALKLGISDHTVKFHLSSAMNKLGAASRAEAVAIAIRRGLIAV